MRIGKAFEMFVFACMSAVSGGGDNGGTSRDGMIVNASLYLG